MSAQFKPANTLSKEQEKSWNCICFALGNAEAAGLFETPYLPSIRNFSNKFEEVLTTLEIEFEKIEDLDPANQVEDTYPGEYVIALIGYQYPLPDDDCGFETDYHVVRKNPSGDWIHKDGYPNPVEPFDVKDEWKNLSDHPYKWFWKIKQP